MDSTSLFHLPDFIIDLGLITLTASVVSMLFKAIKQPAVLGYLVTGVLVGPYVKVFPSVIDSSGIKTWADLGVIVLLFGLGLEFSLRKLAALGKSAVIAAIFEMLSMLSLGFIVGQALGWSFISSVFLGGVLTISSTTIILRTVDDLGLKGRKFVDNILGILIMEDILAVVLIVFLSTAAVAKAGSGLALTYSLLKLGFFLILWFTIGIFALPAIFKTMRKVLNEESLLLVSFALCLVMVIISYYSGFSPVLGAFVMGSLLADMPEKKKIEHLITPLKHIFVAIFFVSVGMIFNPSILISKWPLIILLCVILIGGNMIANTIGGVIAGEKLKDSLKVGISLAQIGEFSFIIAGVGINLKVINSDIYSLAIAVSAVTTITTPYLIKYADDISGKIEQLTPNMILRLIDNHHRIFATTTPWLWWSYFRSVFNGKFFLNFILALAINIIIFRFGLAQLKHIQFLAPYRSYIATGAAILLTAPFFGSMVLSKPRPPKKPFDKKISALIYSLLFARIAIVIILFFIMISTYLNLKSLSWFVILIIVGIKMFSIKYSQTFYHWLEQRFNKNLEFIAESEKNVVAEKKYSPLSPWQAELAEIILSPTSEYVGKSLIDARLRENYDINVVVIERGNRPIIAPSGREPLFPGDRLFVLGAEHSLKMARNNLETIETPAAKEHIFVQESILLTPHTPFTDRAIKDSEFNANLKGLIVGVEREGKRFLNPRPEFKLLAGDKLLVVCERESLKTFYTKNYDV